MTRLEVVDNDADVVHPLDRHVPEPSGRRWRHRCPYIRLDGELPAGSPAPGGDEWYWHRVVPALRERGHDAVSVPLPAADETAGWSEYADVIAALTRPRRTVAVWVQRSTRLRAEGRRPDRAPERHDPEAPRAGGLMVHTRQHEAQLEYLARIRVHAGGRLGRQGPVLP